ncbi:hypothetical protein [Xanthomonas hortorum]|uniref:Secreted protein n=1 Tax=Xanthomonas hortorum pv. gardneri TaxID=2754056 RepID=A0A6V7BR29_9XANT|nr:hypothetical protein [Xanthomonas hortorum]APP82118.1 hypothetical protein BJD10_22785 [Xanthomonas hortorum pv. gardneri]MCC8500998.1 hypothetical protein [Xanthomonas hortorum pv. gardneri]MCC8509761.1 hypothetical protein [Xanthomonas hortorum pv. gardneri]MCC8514061.1 hypothetical protein [Xanthomonas hortorum pv. gardneri]MCC8522840.1 hypothetical protein [Xanthomonas hortorum pv. gardneri]
MAPSNFSFRSRSILRSVMLPGLLLALGACSAGESAAPAASPATSTSPAVTPAPAMPSGNDGLATLIQASGVKCTDTKTAKGCTAGNLDAGDFYDVELSPECGDDGFFAGIAQANGVDALSTVPTTGSNAVANANLAQGQLVCVQGIGRAGQNPLYYYVVAIPASSVAKCKNNALCEKYGDRPIKRLKPAAGDACHAAAPGQYVGDCAQGWVSADALDVFSNGL